MRITFLTLAALGAAAVGGAALAQPASTTAGHRPGMHAPPAAGDFLRSPRGFGRGMHRGSRGHHGRSGRDRLPSFYLGLGGYGEPAPAHGDGFFAGGGEVRMEGGRPVYDYDRSYPYEWASAAAPASDRAGGERYEMEPRCAVESGVRVCRGRR